MKYIITILLIILIAIASFLTYKVLYTSRFCLKITKSEGKKSFSRYVYKPEFIEKNTYNFYYTNLSEKFNYNLITEVLLCSNCVLDSFIRIVKIFDKNDNLLQTINIDIECGVFTGDSSFFDVRSYITGYNKNKIPVDQYYGELIIADLNFDNKEDFAVIYDIGFYNGPKADFYLQNSNNLFILDSFLTNKIWFPDKIDKSNKTLTFGTIIGFRGYNEEIIKYETKTNSWKVLKDTTFFN